VYPEEEPMGARIKQHQLTLVALATVAIAVASAPGSRAQSAEDLQRELEEMKAQLKQLQDKMEKQEELIKKLSAQKPPTPPAKAAAAPTPSAAPAAAEAEVEERVTERIMERIQPSLAAANKTFPSQFNPAIGLAIDTVGSYQEHGGANFEFRSAELGLSASIDPFARGYAFFNGTDEGVDVEEAALVTTSLPWNLTLKGGRFFADFGRLSKFHDHDLPFVNRPTVLDEYVGGESQADGVELSYLVPLEQFLTLTLGAYNKMGADNEQVSNEVPRAFNRFTYLFHPATFVSLNDSNSIDLGANLAWTPKVDDFTTLDGLEAGNGKARYLTDFDITYRYIPLSQAAYRGLIWGTEVLYNNEDWNFGTEDAPVFQRANAWGLYSYVEPKLTRVFYPGFMFNYNQTISRTIGGTTTYSPYLTIWVSEFQRIRLQYTYFDAPQDHQSQFFLQWTGVLGSHAHGFRER
jgi:hypothetical protein